MQQLRKALIRIFLPGTLVAGAIAVAAELFLDAGQCPADYTQQQVDASGCLVGANIGLGLAWWTAMLVEAITIMATVVAWVIWRRHARTGGSSH